MTLSNYLKAELYAFRWVLFVSGGVWMCGGVMLIAAIHVWPTDVIALGLCGLFIVIVGLLKLMLADKAEEWKHYEN
jgi:hypothetical protein